MSLQDLLNPHLFRQIYATLSILREAGLQMRKEELCGNNDVIADNKVTGETVGGAELCQRQMHLVKTKRKREREERMKSFGQIF